MKLKLFHKHLTAISIIFLVAIIIALFSTKMIFDKKNDKDEIRNCDIALITYGSIDDAYFALVESGVRRAAESLSMEYNIFSADDYQHSYETVLKAAVESEAKYVVLPDAAFEETIYNAQNEYTRTKFLLIDGIPHNSDNSDVAISDNVLSVSYDEAEAGFVAGYAAITEGYDKLCFVCDDTSPKSMHFCYGFLQGADYAVSEEGNQADTNPNRAVIEIIHMTPETNREMVINRIASDTDVVATSNSEIIDMLNGEREAADISNSSDIVKYPVIFCGGYNLDRDNVVATVTNDISAMVNDVMIDYDAGNVSGGSVLNFDTRNNSVSFVSDGETFTKFSDETLRALIRKISSGDITIISDTTVSTEELGITHVTVRSKLP